ncbi:hypothetical protein [Cerasicoccus arenae]|uniref:hypothetical protein n=1 Tax=Cerasicoccus arenae TaxID=424488 RepID=UPI001675ADD9|nr:hypothetical protein [Cerasicoccus arenae]MBK1858721.1 hypothetical protein [Cerasicoccus arenae]
MRPDRRALPSAGTQVVPGFFIIDANQRPTGRLPHRVPTMRTQGTSSPRKGRSLINETIPRTNRLQRPETHAKKDGSTRRQKTNQKTQWLLTSAAAIIVTVFIGAVIMFQ